jgi:alpha-tubulin suppressor-like RCC1 family protein
MSIAARGAFSYFITLTGDVLACGNDNKGQLGISRSKDDQDVPLPTRVPTVKGVQVSQVFCGLHHTFALAG